jgi:hypothetical protein
MTVVPTETPDTTPEPLTVATAILLDDQGVVGCAVAEPVNILVAPTQADAVPLIVGRAYTVIVPVAVALPQPVGVIVYVNVPLAIGVPLIVITLEA